MGGCLELRGKNRTVRVGLGGAILDREVFGLVGKGIWRENVG